MLKIPIRVELPLTTYDAASSFPHLNHKQRDGVALFSYEVFINCSNEVRIVIPLTYLTLQKVILEAMIYRCGITCTIAWYQSFQIMVHKVICRRLENQIRWSPFKVTLRVKGKYSNYYTWFVKHESCYLQIRWQLCVLYSKSYFVGFHALTLQMVIFKHRGSKLIILIQNLFDSPAEYLISWRKWLHSHYKCYDYKYSIDRWILWNVQMIKTVFNILWLISIFGLEIEILYALITRGCLIR